MVDVSFVDDWRRDSRSLALFSIDAKANIKGGKIDDFSTFKRDITILNCSWNSSRGGGYFDGKDLFM